MLINPTQKTRILEAIKSVTDTFFQTIVTILIKDAVYGYTDNNEYQSFEVNGLGVPKPVTYEGNKAGLRDKKTTLFKFHTDDLFDVGLYNKATGTHVGLIPNECLLEYKGERYRAVEIRLKGDLQDTIIICEIEAEKI